MTNPESPTLMSSRFLPTVSEGLLLAGATLAGYAVCLSYEAGRLAWFGLPSWLISLEPERVLSSLGAVALVLFTARNFVGMLPNLPWLALIVCAWRPFFTLTLATLVAATLPWGPDAASAMMAFILIVLSLLIANSTSHDLVAPLFKYRDQHKSWFDRWEASIIARPRKRPELLTDVLDEALAKRYGLAFPLLVVLTPGLFLGAYFLGKHNAAGQTHFALIASPKPCVVVERYGTSLVCIDIDPSSHSVLNTFRTIPLDDGPLVLEHAATGPLSPPPAEQ